MAHKLSIQGYEALEHILTTPLPFVVWLYLFLLPLQLVNDFGWHTVPAARLPINLHIPANLPVCVGAVVYLGFLAAGEEIEQPFGYDDNDLDLDIFCRDIVRQDIRSFKKAPCLNACTLAGGLHAYGGNLYPVSLASLSDSASVITEEEEEDPDTETESEHEARTRQAEEVVRVGELVDTR
ncbi:hypothetical protein C8R45DRAFT_1096290 [Mycena sanguinolenta]|nr:hypothetical protein C8R45DRAFT_1096290 [Mycena sanguinolenta]